MHCGGRGGVAGGARFAGNMVPCGACRGQGAMTEAVDALDALVDGGLLDEALERLRLRREDALGRIARQEENATRAVSGGPP